MKPFRPRLKCGHFRAQPHASAASYQTTMAHLISRPCIRLLRIGQPCRVHLVAQPRRSGFSCAPSSRCRVHGTSTNTEEVGAAAAQIQGLASPQATAWKWEESDDGTTSYSILALVLAAGLLPPVQANQVADLPYFISLAVATIYIGAHRSLTTTQRQMISLKEGALAPVLASVSLFACYLVVKYFPEISLQTFLNAYFWLLGSLAAWGATGPLLRKVTGPLGKKTISLNVPEGLVLDDKGGDVTTVQLAPSDLLSVVLSVGLATAEVASNHSNFTLNNLMACLIATEILQVVGLRSFRTAALMLTGLLAYDVFWVFGSPSVVGDNVMLEVATSDIITGPMRLLFPRQPGGMGEAAGFQFSLLGLGDVAIPGLLACLALRYDATRVVDMKARAQVAGDAISEALAALDSATTSAGQMADAAADAAFTAYDKFADRETTQRDRTTKEGAHSEAAASSGQGSGMDAHQEPLPVSEGVLQQRPYFMAVATSYVAGLAIAFAANAITHLGQPALLYIVPCTLGAAVSTAISRDELYRLWQYTDVPTFGPAAEYAKKVDGKDKVKS